MKTLNIIAALVMALGSAQALAKSKLLDSERLGTCGVSRSSEIELRKSDNGDLSIKLDGIDTRRCQNFNIKDHTSGKTIKAYQPKDSKSTYTFSKAQQEALSADCKIDLALSGSGGRENFEVTLGGCRSSSKPKSSADLGYSFQISGKGNCKLMRDGEYQNMNVDDIYCVGAKKGDNMTFDYSNKNNCKRMKNGNYVENVSDKSLCQASF